VTDAQLGITSGLLKDLRPAMLNETLKYLSPSKMAGCMDQGSAPSKITAADREAAARTLLVNTRPAPFQPAAGFDMAAIPSYHQMKLRELQSYNPGRAREHLHQMRAESHVKYEIARQMRLSY